MYAAVDEESPGIDKDALRRSFASAAMEIKSLVREADGLDEFVQIFKRFRAVLRQVLLSLWNAKTLMGLTSSQ